MKVVSDYMEDIFMDKTAGVDPLVFGTALTIPALAGAVAGSAYSSFAEPPPGKYEEFEQELLKQKLMNVLKERAYKKRIKKMESLLDENRKSIRI